MHQNTTFQNETSVKSFYKLSILKPKLGIFLLVHQHYKKFAKNNSKTCFISSGSAVSTLNFSRQVFHGNLMRKRQWKQVYWKCIFQVSQPTNRAYYHNAASLQRYKTHSSPARHQRQDYNTYDSALSQAVYRQQDESPFKRQYKKYVNAERNHCALLELISCEHIASVLATNTLT